MCVFRLSCITLYTTVSSLQRERTEGSEDESTEKKKKKKEKKKKKDKDADRESPNEEVIAINHAILAHLLHLSTPPLSQHTPFIVIIISLFRNRNKIIEQSYGRRSLDSVFGTSFTKDNVPFLLMSSCILFTNFSFTFENSIMFSGLLSLQN